MPSILVISSVILILLIHNAKCQSSFSGFCNPGTRHIPTGGTWIQGSPNYPMIYSGPHSCVWMYRTVRTSYLKAICDLSLPCNSDYILVSRSGDPTFYRNTLAYCGTGRVIIEAVANTMSIYFHSSSKTSGGWLHCKISSIARNQQSTMTTRTLSTTLRTTSSSTTRTSSTTTVTTNTRSSLGAVFQTTTASTNTSVAPTVSTTSLPSQGCSCGVKQMPRVVGGISASEFEFPWIGLLLLNGKGPYCGASIISKRWVLSAAHCTESLQPVNLTLLLGRYTFSIPRPTDQFRNVIQIIIHPSYDNLAFNNDISLLKMDEDLAYSMAIQPVCLPFPFPTKSFAGEKATIVGWGTSSEFVATVPDFVRKATTTIIANSNCTQMFSSTLGITVNPEFLCAFQQGIDACYGDSGGPLFWTNPSTDTVFLVGITSWGIGCARSEFPGVYTRLTVFLNWIQNQTGERFCT